MSRLDVLSDSLNSLFKEWIEAQGSPAQVRAFYTSVLGLPYEFEGTRLTVEHLEDTMRDQPDMDWIGGPNYDDCIVTAGIDVGTLLHTTISVVDRDEDGNPVRRCVFVAALNSFEEVQEKLIQYRVDIAVMDAQPETHKAQELRDYFIEKGGTQFWLCRFHPTPRVGHQKYGWRLDWRGRIIRVDRTAVFDVSFSDVVEGRRQFPRDALAVNGWSAQMRAPVRVTNEDNTRIIWVEGSAADHFRLADVYDRVAADLLDAGGSFFTA